MLFIQLILFSFLLGVRGKSKDTLVLVHALFRHGNRTPDKIAIYPTDPHKNETYYPYDYGQLTNEGKRTEYDLGKNLRQRYDKFLGPIYTPDVLYSVSTYYPRTRMSLLLVLAGLYPPKSIEIWNPLLNWQPIPYDYFPGPNDLTFPFACGNISTHRQDFLRLPDNQKQLKKWKDIFAYMAKHSGFNVTSADYVYGIYFTLAIEEELGLKLPEWTRKVYPEPIRSIAIWNYQTYAGSTILKKEISGALLKKIIDDTQAKIKGTLDPQNRKIFLYSAHELNVATFLMTLGVWKPHIPNYGSNIIIEVHNIDDVYGVKIFYQNNVYGPRELLTIPKCADFCPLDKFIRLMKDYIRTYTICDTCNG